MPATAAPSRPASTVADPPGPAGGRGLWCHTVRTAMIVHAGRAASGVSGRNTAGARPGVHASVLAGAGPRGVRMDDSPDLVDLFAAAAAGNQTAWDQLVDRFIPLVRHVIRSFRLAPEDADDAAQSVWLRLIEHLKDIREPLALPGWISTTTRNECLIVLRTKRRTTAVGDAIDAKADMSIDVDPTEALYREQRREALLQGLAELPERHRALLTLLLHDPPVPYDEISRRLDMPVGSIGPSRARALQKLRETRAMASLLTPDSEGHR